MAIFRWRANWNPLHDLEHQVDRLLESIRTPFPALRVDRQFPPLNLYELPEEYLVTSELPGIASQDLELTVVSGLLTMKGSRGGPEGIADERFRRHERLWGKWERSFPLPDRVNEEKVSAEFSDGVLKIHLPKAPAIKPRQIQVASGD